jgi:GTP-binding protein Era
VGDKLSIVTPKAQTTWQRVTGILTTDTAQMIFLDTPGILSARDLLQRSMLGAALLALEEADVVLLVVDASNPPGKPAREAIASALELSRVRRFAAINKTDAASDGQIQTVTDWVQNELGAEAMHISALEGSGLEHLMTRLDEALPPGPFLYPADDIASEPVRFFVSELIRETIFEQFRQEIPYSVFAQIEDFRENQDPVYIGATVFAETNSQKRILIGDGGRAIKQLGRESRMKIEEFLGRPVYLDLWIKHLANWRRKRGHLKRLGFRVPDEHELLTRP